MTDQLNLGHFLLPLSGINKVVCDHQLRVLDGHEVLSHYRKGGETLSRLQELCSPIEAIALEGRVAGLANNDAACFYFNPSGGKSFSGVLISREDEVELLCIDGEVAYDILERSTFFLKYFLATPIAICLTDVDGNILDVNPAFVNLYRLAGLSLIGENPRIIKSGRQSPDTYKEMWNRITDPQDGQWLGEIVNRRGDGEEVDVMLTISAVRNESSQLQGFVASAFDISRRKAFERRLRQQNDELAELNTLKNELLAVTSHDLKSPLNAMISRANLIKAMGSSMAPDKMAEQLDQLIATGHKLGRFIDDILDLEKINSGQAGYCSQRFSLDGMLESVADLHRVLAAEKQVEICKETTGRPIPWRGDQGKLEQVFSNLTVNAIKYSPPGSRIDLRLRYLDAGCQIEICDQGPGIPVAERDRIFDRFYQVKNSSVTTRAYGAGYGLSIVKKYVELHQGQVSVDANVGGGSVFRVTLAERGSVHSGADLAALIVEPDGRLYSLVEPHLKARNICSYFCKLPGTMARILKFEIPELLILAAGVRHDPEFMESLDLFTRSYPNSLVIEMNPTDDENSLVDGIGESVSQLIEKMGDVRNEEGS